MGISDCLFWGENFMWVLKFFNVWEYLEVGFWSYSISTVSFWTLYTTMEGIIWKWATETLGDEDIGYFVGIKNSELLLVVCGFLEVHETLN